MTESDWEPWPQGVWPPAEITPREFEDWLGDIYRAAAGADAVVTVRDRVTGPDGTYELDVTVRYRVAGLDHVLICEAKKHNHPIKRELVQTLHAKVRSLGAQKGALFATSSFQRGAIEYAKAHGIALVHVTEGRFTYIQRAEGSETLTHEEAAEHGLPLFVGLRVQLKDDGNSLAITMISSHHSKYLADLLPGRAEE